MVKYHYLKEKSSKHIHEKLYRNEGQIRQPGQWHWTELENKGELSMDEHLLAFCGGYNVPFRFT